MTSLIESVPAVRAIAAFILVFLLPGFAWSLVFFKKNINIIERVTLSLGLSIALVALAVLVLNVLFHVRINGFNALITVVVNLLDNAYKYSGDEKEIAIRVFAEEGRVCFSVADNGVGISRRDRKRIFERFYQVDQSLSRAAGGCGLGLAIVKFIVDAHGGTVDVASEPGKGSEFIVRLPAHGGAVQV